MKQCPNCKTTYTDETLRFCLNDGANLIDVPEAETVRMSFDKNPMRVSVAPPDSAPTVFAAPQIIQQQPPKRKSAGLIIAGILGVLLLLVGGGLFAAFMLFRPTENKNPVAAASPAPTTSPTATPNDETTKLKEEMANLQKQLQDQKNQKQTAPANASLPPKQTSSTTARANSPRDGFLALRSEPNSETGYRVAQIPHGATLTVLGCPKSSNIGKMAGRWCQVVYNGQSGWAFDAFMTF